MGSCAGECTWREVTGRYQWINIHEGCLITMHSVYAEHKHARTRKSHASCVMRHASCVRSDSTQCPLLLIPPHHTQSIIPAAALQ